MNRLNHINYYKNKYPDIFDGDQISLYKVGDILNIYNFLEKDKDYKSLELLKMVLF